MLKINIRRKAFQALSLIMFFSFLIILGIGEVRASSTEQPLLYLSQTCKYCLEVKEKIVDEGLDKRVEISHIEVRESTENFESFKEKLDICGINSNNATVPMLYADGKCYRSVDSIMQKLNSMANGEVLPEEQERVVDEKGKKNTEKLIVGISIFLLVLPLFGYLLRQSDTKKGKKKIGRSKSIKMILVAIFSFSFLFLTKPAYAICPVCTIAVGAGVGISRYLGIDDTISGIWIGGLMSSSALWLINFVKSKFKKKTSNVNVLSFLLFVLTVLLFLVSLKLSGILGHELNTIWGIDKVLVGITVGSISFLIGQKVHKTLLRINRNRVFIPFQKVEIPLLALLITTIIFYLIVY